LGESACPQTAPFRGGLNGYLGYNEQQDLDSTLDVAEQKLFAVTRRRRGPDFVPLRQAVQAYFDRIQRDEDELVVPTGLTDLDVKLNGGLRPGQLVLLAARPGVGKTGLALSIAYHLGVTSGRSIIVDPGI
jgi:replicative DNA helicase